MKTSTLRNNQHQRRGLAGVSDGLTNSAVALAILTAAQSPILAGELLVPVLAAEEEEEGNSDSAALEKYFNQGYNYADAKVLAAFWDDGTDVGDAKIRLGNKMLNFGPNDGRAVIREARAAILKRGENRWPVDYEDGGYTFEDAELLGKYWGGDASDGKTKIERLLIQGKDKDIQSALAAAKEQGEDTDEGHTDEQAMNKFFAQGYNYVDALVLADYWGDGTDFAGAKIRLGNKMLDFGPADGQLHVRNARAAASKKGDDELPVNYTDGGYTFADAKALATYWGYDAYESKTKIARLLIAGNEKQVKTALKAAKSRKKGE